MTTNGTPAPTTNEQVRHALARLDRLLTNATTLPFSRTRGRSIRGEGDGRRDVAEECGWPTSPTPDLYQGLYDRHAIAARTVEVLPKESWQVTPSIYEEEDADTVTPFEQAIDGLGRSLQTEESWYDDEQGSALWDLFLQADVLSGIGSHGAMLLGLDDKQDLRTPAVFRPGQKLLYARPFPESLAVVSRLETDPHSRRNGLPVEYQFTFNAQHDDNSPALQAGGNVSHVHWTRVIHITDTWHTAPVNAVFAVPRMKPVLDHLLDLRKIYGASAEGYWQSGVPLYSFETDPSLGGDVEVDDEGMKDAIEQLFNGLQRYIRLNAFTAKSLAPSVVDPTPQVAVQIEAICIKLGIPIRVFKGSERGELASSQDDAAWNDRLRQRQSGYISPRIIQPFINRLISLGVLPKPQRYCVWWPDLTSQTDTERAAVAVQKTSALAQYVGGQVESLIPPLDYLTRIMGMDEEEAGAILDAAGEESQAPALPAPSPPPSGPMAERPQRPALEPSANVLNCGGPGSGVPGPCPLGVAMKPVGTRGEGAGKTVVYENPIPRVPEAPYAYPGHQKILDVMEKPADDPAYPTQMVDPMHLLSDQRTVDKSRLDKIEGAIRTPIAVVQHEGKLYIAEGNHRAVKAAMRGEKVPVKIIEVKEKKVKYDDDE